MNYKQFELIPHRIRPYIYDIMMRQCHEAQSLHIDNEIATALINSNGRRIQTWLDAWHILKAVTTHEKEKIEQHYKLGILDLPLVARIEAQCTLRLTDPDYYPVEAFQALEMTFGGITWNSGGNIYLWSLVLGDAHTITVGEDSLCVYKWESGVSYNDRLFLNHQDPETIYFVEFSK